MKKRTHTSKDTPFYVKARSNFDTNGDSMEAAARTQDGANCPPRHSCEATARWSMKLNQRVVTAEMGQSWVTDLPDADIIACTTLPGGEGGTAITHHTPPLTTPPPTNGHWMELMASFHYLKFILIFLW